MNSILGSIDKLNMNLLMYMKIYNIDLTVLVGEE